MSNVLKVCDVCVGVSPLVMRVPVYHKCNKAFSSI